MDSLCYENGCGRKHAERKNHVWSYDFVMDRTEDGRRLKMLVVVDEYTRECPCIEVQRGPSPAWRSSEPWRACSQIEEESPRTSAQTMVRSSLPIPSSGGWKPPE